MCDCFNNILKFFKYIFRIKFEKKEIKIILNYLEKKYQEGIMDDLSKLSGDLIRDKPFINELSQKIRTFSQKRLKKQKIFLLGETGVGKSTLINCIEEKLLAPESIVDAPTTMQYKEYESEKYQNFIFCDTRGIEKNNIKEIEKDNIDIILNNIKDYSYLFWFLKGSSSNFQDTDAKFIKSMEKELNGNMPFFFVITKSTDEVEDKRKLNETIKEYFPYKKNIPIFPLYARGTIRMQSFGVKELMDETKNFFGKIIIEEAFKDIYKINFIYGKESSDYYNDYSEEYLFSKILDKVRLTESTEIKINDAEKVLIENFIKEKFWNFQSLNLTEIIKLCSLIKAKYEVIDMDKDEIISSNLTAINNSIEVNNENNSLEDEILKGCSQSDKEKILSKMDRYVSIKKMERESKMIIKWFFADMFYFELKKQIENNLLKINGLFD